MKISELIEKLQKFQKIVGDVHVIVEPKSYDGDYGDPRPRIDPTGWIRAGYCGDEELTNTVVVI